MLDLQAYENPSEDEVMCQTSHSLVEELPMASGRLPSL